MLAPDIRFEQTPISDDTQTPTDFLTLVMSDIATAHGLIESKIQSILQQIPTVQPRIDRTDPLMQKGLNSLGVAELHNLLQGELGDALSLPSTMVFDYPTIASIAAYVTSQIDLSNASSAVQLDHKDCCVSGAHIASMQCITPDGGHSQGLVWNLMTSGHNSVRMIPMQRYGFEHTTEGTKYGHFVEGIELFDNSAFGMSAIEAATTDPNHRILLELAGGALITARPGKEALVGARIGVFVGFCHVISWAMLQRDRHVDVNVFSGHGSDCGSAAGRISYTLALKGPCLHISTACSSSLVALDTARRNLRDHACDGALIAGINLQLHISVWQMLVPLRVLAPNGQCKTFDAAADGFCRSDAGIAVTLYGNDDSNFHSLTGTAVNQDGRSASFMAPNGPSQEAVIHAALTSPNPNHCFESHGTGTSLGDPVEFGALTRVWLSNGVLAPECMIIGALKTQNSHSEGASGVVGLSKAILSLSHRISPSNLHLQQTNPRLADHEGMFIVPSNNILSNLGQLSSSSIGVSSFGFSGTNAHVVVAIQGRFQMSLEENEAVCYIHKRFSWWCASELFLGPCKQPRNDVTVWECAWTNPCCVFMAHHRVGETPVAPGTAFLQMAHAAVLTPLTDKIVCMSNVEFTSMLHLDSIIRPTLRVSYNTTAVTLSIESKSAAMDDWLSHATLNVTLQFKATAHSSPQLLPCAADECTKAGKGFDGDTFYASTGSDYRGVTAIADYS